MKRYYEKIMAFYKNAKRMPSYSEILKITGLKSKNAVHKIVKKLESLNLIEKDFQGRIIPKQIFEGIKLLGAIEAGFPSPAEEELIDTISLDEFLIKNKEATYLLKVSGTSMIDAGIKPGDIALVERNRTPKDGDIVIAEVDGNWTMKYFKNKCGKIYLAPANKKFEPIVPKSELKIAAVVTAIIRKYK